MFIFLIFLKFYDRYLNLATVLKPLQEHHVRRLYDDGDGPINPSNENVELPLAAEELTSPNKLLNWSQLVTQPYRIHLENLTTSWKTGLAFCAIINRFRNDLMYVQFF